MNVELMAKTQVFTTVNSLQNHLAETARNKTIGFVPTMGALHDGHITLVKAAADDCDVVVVSIFVNPTQFNEAADLEKYPRTLEADLALLSQTTECIVFSPSVKEMYPENHVPKRMDLGLLGTVMEGSSRKGHFDGVVEVVYRLFEIVKPTRAYFGEKDFQQLAVMRKMVHNFQLPIQIVGCPIYREPGGLAASSRNQRLNSDELKKSLILYRSLLEAKSKKENQTPAEARERIADMFESSELELEYIEFVDADTFETVTHWTDHTQGCIAARCGEVRLLDNMSM